MEIIDIKNNNMNELNFHWKAIFIDGTTISQFDENKKEHKFQEVKDRFSDLIRFELYKKDMTQVFAVDLINGLIYDSEQVIPKEFKKSKSNIRLIFFRRHQVDLNDNMKEINHRIVYFLGFQYNDDDNINKKIIFQIDGKGNFLVGD